MKNAEVTEKIYSYCLPQHIQWYIVIVYQTYIFTHYKYMQFESNNKCSKYNLVQVCVCGFWLSRGLFCPCPWRGLCGCYRSVSELGREDWELTLWRQFGWRNKEDIWVLACWTLTKQPPAFKRYPASLYFQQSSEITDALHSGVWKWLNKLIFFNAFIICYNDERNLKELELEKGKRNCLSAFTKPVPKLYAFLSSLTHKINFE